jgi:hypothetical protein
MPRKNVCAHPPCKCIAPAGEEYCSEHCMDAVADAEPVCRCGHPECESP